MLTVNAGSLPLVRIKSAVVPGCGPRYLKETDEARNLGSDVNPYPTNVENRVSS